MMSNQLKFDINIKQSSYELKVTFKDPFFARIVKFIQFSTFPKHLRPLFEYHVHVHDIQFKPTIKLQKDQQFRFKQLAQFLQKQLSRINYKKIKTKFNADEEFEDQEKIIKFSSLVGHKFVRFPVQDYEEGDLMLYGEKQEIKRISKNIVNFINEQILFEMTPIIQKNKIQEEHQKDFLDLFISSEKDKIEHLAQQFKFKIVHISPAFQAIQDDDYWCLLIQIKGVAFNLNEFYLAFRKYIESLQIKIIPVNQVKCCRLDEIHSKFEQYKFSLVDYKHIVIINDNINLPEIESELKRGKWLISEQFSKEELLILDGQWKSQSFKEYLSVNGLEFDEINLTQNRIILHCDEKTKENFIEKSKKYLQNFKSEKKKIQQFKDQLLIRIFMKEWQKPMKRKYIVSFSVQSQSLYQTYFLKDENQLAEDLSKIKEHILSEIVLIPSAKPVSFKLAQEQKIQGMYKQKRNPPFYGLSGIGSMKFQVNSTQIEIMPVGRLCSYEEHLIYIVFDEDNSFDSPIMSLMEENELRFDLFFYDATSRKPVRIKQYILTNAWICSSLFLFYVDEKEPNFNHIEDDLNKLVRKVEKSDKINIVIAPIGRSFVDKIFIKMLGKLIYETEENINPDKICIYYEDKRTVFSLPQKIQGLAIGSMELKINKISNFYLNEWDIKKLNGIPFFKLYYLKDQSSRYLGGLSSYIFQYQRYKNINRRNRYLMCLPSQPEQYPLEFLIYFPLRIVHLVAKTTVTIIKPDEELVDFINVVEKYFKNLEYCVIMAKDMKDNYDYCYSFYIADDHDCEAYELGYVREVGKIKRTGKNPVKFHLTEEKYLEWFEIKAYKRQIDKILKSLQN